MKIHQFKGFTLIEILVVLVITGFIVTLLLQSLQQVFFLQKHFGHEIFYTQRGAMYADWFRQSINSLMPDYKEGKHKFSGDYRRMSGLTLAPLAQEAGALAPFVWRLEFDLSSGQTGLYYGNEVEKDSALPLLAWLGNDGRFIYTDAKNEAHDSWPPFLGAWPQLPSSITLESGSGERLRLIVAAPRSADTPPLSRKEIEAL
jgi:general secretion pathway protein J